MNRKRLIVLFACAALLSFFPAFARADSSKSSPNILIVTVDDMSCDSVGAFGCQLPGTTPSIDQFAKTAMKFSHAHVHVGNCMPSRNIMWSGMYSCQNGIEGFRQQQKIDYPTLCDLAKSAGYYAAIRGKVTHSTPYHPYAWDEDATISPAGQKYALKDPKSYGASVRQVIQAAEKNSKPFCLMVNISDPHKPFYGVNGRGEVVDDPFVPTRLFDADTVPVPGFLHDSQAVRKELVHYYNSVRRADDCFREVMAALQEGEKEDNTFVMFLSDHGMPLPFAKTQLYHHSTHTPLLIRWPQVTTGGKVDNQHLVGAIDFVPTLLEVMGQAHPTPERLQGRSMVPLLRGETQDGRDHVIVQYYENSGRRRHPMRGIQTREHLYLYNAWSDGVNKFATATTGTATYRDMVLLAKSNPAVAARLELFDHRVPEELYNVQHDPDCLDNLIASEDMRTIRNRLRQRLAERLKEIQDPMAFLLEDPENEQKRKAFMESQPVPKAKKNQGRQKQKNAARKK